MVIEKIDCWLLVQNSFFLFWEKATQHDRRFFFLLLSREHIFFFWYRCSLSPFLSPPMFGLHAGDTRVINWRKKMTVNQLKMEKWRNKSSLCACTHTRGLSCARCSTPSIGRPNTKKYFSLPFIFFLPFVKWHLLRTTHGTTRRTGTGFNYFFFKWCPFIC